MSARLLDGNSVAASIRAEVAARAVRFAAKAGRPPGLGIVLAGNNAASEIYIRNKVRAGGEAGLRVDVERLPAGATLGDMLALVERLNGSDAHDGILVQSPLPAAMGPAARVFDAIDPAKDVDGFHPVNVGRLVQNRATLAPCTPSGIIELLERSGIPLRGAHAVVLGRSDIVGKPTALLLLHRNATVTVCHSRTRDLAAVTRTADILVAAIGRPAFLTAAMVKPGSTVVDVGINRLSDPAAVERLFPPDSPRRAEFARRGAVLVGDVHPDVALAAGALTPVPGGVGPLTIAMLMRNTVRAANLRISGGDD
jgi:methylenetetrahydrofolate dehydrogenase (NADP+)/methenyltetrahydrofolate cyclohydrolase